MNCQEIRENIKAYIDGELGCLVKWRIARHIARCTECKTEEATMRTLTDQVKTLSAHIAPQNLRERVLGQLNINPESAQAQRRLWLLNPIYAGAVVLVVFAMAGVLYPVLKASNTAVTRGAVQKASVPSCVQPEIVAQKTAKSQIEEKSAVGAAKFRADNSRFRADTYDFAYTGSNTSSTKPDFNPNQLIIKNADLTVQVKNFEQTNNQVILIARSVGGYIANTSASTDTNAPISGTFELRVPVRSFEQVMERLGKLGKIASKSISGEDVTSEVVDLESRMRNKRAEERQYLEIMNRARRITDVVTVSNELYRVRGEIEEAQGRIKYLKDSAAMSTINLTLAEKRKTKPEQSFIQNTWHNALGSLGNTAGSIFGILIWLAVYSPFWAVPVGIPLYLRKRTFTSQQTANPQ